MNNKNSPADIAISFEETADLISDSKVISFLDLRHSIVYRLEHPERGKIIVLNSASGDGALLAA